MPAADVRRRRRPSGGRARALVAALIVGGSSVVALPAAAYPIDSDRSDVEFSLRVAWLRRIAGHFPDIEGAIDLGDERFSIDVRIPVHALEMNNPSHAAWARSEEFFDAERYPWLQFQAADLPLSLLRAGGDLRGELRLRGVRHPQTLELEPAGCARPGIDCPVRARAEVHRSDYGMDSRRVVISDRVRLQLSIWLAP